MRDYSWLQLLFAGLFWAGVMAVVVRVALQDARRVDDADVREMTDG